MPTLRHIARWLKHQASFKLFISGFAVLIVVGALLLMLPFATTHDRELPFIDALFTATSAVCVTGLYVVPTGAAFTLFGRLVLMFLIQIGGLGIAFAGAGVVMLSGKRLGFKEKHLVKEAFSAEHANGMPALIRYIVWITVAFEGAGALLSLPIFLQDYPPLKAIEVSLFHSIASFCNAGFDILGGASSLEYYTKNYYLLTITSILIIAGGLGFLVIVDILSKRSFKKLSLQSKIVITTSLALILLGTWFIWITDNVDFVSSLFLSISARTAGFATVSLRGFSPSGVLVVIILMFIGASPGSTGGGIKTTTFAILLKSIYSYITRRSTTAFYRKISDDIIIRALVLFSTAVCLLMLATYLLCILEPKQPLIYLIFEVTSAFATVGLSHGITPELTTLSKLILIVLMFCGRLGIFTMVAGFSQKEHPHAEYSREFVSIG